MGNKWLFPRLISIYLLSSFSSAVEFKWVPQGPWKWEAVVHAQPVGHRSSRVQDREDFQLLTWFNIQSHTYENFTSRSHLHEQIRVAHVNSELWGCYGFLSNINKTQAIQKNIMPLDFFTVINNSAKDGRWGGDWLISLNSRETNQKEGINLPGCNHLKSLAPEINSFFFFFLQKVNPKRV